VGHEETGNIGQPLGGNKEEVKYYLKHVQIYIYILLFGFRE